MKKANVFRSSNFWMFDGDTLHIIIEDEVGTTATFTLNTEYADGTTNQFDAPDPPIATSASDITSSGFTANLNLSENALGYYLDVAEDSAFTSLVVNNQDIGFVNEYDVTGLDDAITYYYRFRAYNDYGTSGDSNVITTTTANEVVTDADGNVYTYVTIGSQQWMVENFRSTKYADGTAIPNLTESEYDDWFMPSLDELEQMYVNLHLFGVGGFVNDSYPSSSEFSATNIWTFGFHSGLSFSGFDKTFTENFRPCRLFTAGVGEYALRDTGPAGGLIFYISGTTYYEAYPNDINVPATVAWSNVQALAIGTTGTAIGTGQSNTTAIIAQVGHVNSNAKLCDNIDVGGWNNDTTGAYCAYDNDPANVADYGLLYNWYAIDNAHGLAPAGWRVPTETDWTTLQTFLGGYTAMGGVLKEIGLAHWNSPNTGAINEYGFSLRGGGARYGDGSFLDIKDGGETWSSTDSGGDGVMLHCQYNAATGIIDTTGKSYGLSVRMMRDV